MKKPACNQAPSHAARNSETVLPATPPPPRTQRTRPQTQSSDRPAASRSKSRIQPRTQQKRKSKYSMSAPAAAPAGPLSNLPTAQKHRPPPPEYKKAAQPTVEIPATQAQLPAAPSKPAPQSAAASAIHKYRTQTRSKR